MIGRPLRYERPAGLDEALALLEQGGEDARPLAGGQDLVPLLTRNALRPGLVVDLGRVPELAASGRQGATLRLGACATHAELRSSELVAAAAPLLALAAGAIGGGPQVANRGTIGGAVAYANPVGDYLACLVALDATVLLRSRAAERRIAVAAFVRDAFAVDLGVGELVTAIELPAANAERVAYRKLRFSDGCYGIANVACSLGAGIVRLAVGAATAVPVRLRAVEQALAGRELTPALAREAGELAGAAIEEPLTDALAPGDYRRRVVPVLVERVLLEAAGVAR